MFASFFHPQIPFLSQLKQDVLSTHEKTMYEVSNTRRFSEGNIGNVSS